MATQEYRHWVAAGRPFRRPPWLTELKALARAHGVPFLGDLGNDDHLQADFPEDHTPFSRTEWPVPIGEYVINAIDLGDGPWSDRLLADARAGRLPWLKYLNFRKRNYSRKRGFAPVSNSDGHLHVSGMSDHTWTGLGGYNPFVAQSPTPQEDDVTEDDINKIAMRAAVLVQSGRWDHGFQASTGNGAQWFQSSASNSIAAAEERLRTEIRAVADRPAGTIVLTEDDKADLIAGFGAAAEAAVRKVLGAVDGAVPPGNE